MFISLKSLYSHFLFLTQHLRKNNFITDNNEVVCSLKDFNKFRESVHRSKTETEAAKKRVENDEHSDKMRLITAKIVFNKIQTKDKRFREIYEKNGSICCKPLNPTRHGSVLKIMQQRKDEQESEKRKK